MREYAGPNTLLKAFQLIRQAIKSASLSAGDGLTKTGDALSVTAPVRSIVTQAEFDALTEEQQNKGLYVISDGGGGSGGSSAGEVYSTEEIRIGTWIDGKPLYRKVFSTTTPPSTSSTCVATITDQLNLAHLYGFFELQNGDRCTIPYSNGVNTVSAWLAGDGIRMIVASYFTSLPATIVIEYTKTTDEGGTT